MKGDPGTAATRADGPCFDNINRSVDCGNGTVTDTVTGLIWLKQADCLGFGDWASANQAAAGLKNGDCSTTANPLNDGSSAGDWRLPTRDERSATIARGVALGCTYDVGKNPTLTNDAGTACLSEGPSSFAGLDGNLGTSCCWTSTTNETNPIEPWIVNLHLGYVVAYFPKTLQIFSWPVRGGRP